MNTIAIRTRSNFHHLYGDIFWFGVLAGSAGSFLPIYAARLGANSVQMALLTAGPAIVNLIFSLPAGQWLDGKPLIRITFWASLWHRLGYLVFFTLPWVIPDPQQEILAIIYLIFLISIPGTVLAIGFNALFADIVPPDDRPTVVGRRNALLAVSTMATTLACGQLLDRIVFPANYQIVFGLGALGAFMSSYHLSKLQPLEEPISPPRVGQPLSDLARPGLFRFGDAIRPGIALRFLTRARHKPLLRLDIIRGPFGPFVLACFLFYTFQYIPIPLFPLFQVGDLGFTDGIISLGNALFYATMLITSLQLQPITQRFGNRRLLVFGALSYGIYPLLHALATDAILYWIASLISGVVWALTSAGLVNRLMEWVPNHDRPTYMAFHNLALNLGILVGSSLGPVLGEWLGLRQALFVSAVLRFLAGILMGIWG